VPLFKCPFPGPKGLGEGNQMFSCPLGIKVLPQSKYSVLYRLQPGGPYKCLHEANHDSKTLAQLTAAAFEYQITQQKLHENLNYFQTIEANGPDPMDQKEKLTINTNRRKERKKKTTIRHSCVFQSKANGWDRPNLEK